LTSPFAYYQWWFNTDDRDVERFLNLFTFLPLEEIADVVEQHEAEPHLRGGQRRLAEEATRIVHGEAGLQRAQAATGVLFGGESVQDLDAEALAMAFEQADSAEVARVDLDGEGVGLLTLLVEVGAASSNGEARRLVQQGGVRIGDDKVEDDARVVTADDLLVGDAIVLRVGKKRQYLARFV